MFGNSININNISCNLVVLKKGCYCTLVPPRVRVRATVKLSAAFFHDESSITIGHAGGRYKSAIASKKVGS